MNRSAIYFNLLHDILGEAQAPHCQKQSLFYLLNQSDQKIAEIINKDQYQITQRLTSYSKNMENQDIGHKSLSKSKLAVPKNNTLTDSMLRSTLGCEQNLAKQYHQIFTKVNLNEQQIKNARIQDIKKRFTEANNFKDFFANAKAYSTPIKTMPQPFINNKQDQYMKTQLLFLQKPKTLNEKIIFHNKKLKQVAKKIDQLGGIQDTINNMQNTLKHHQISDQKSNQTFAYHLNSSRQNSNKFTKDLSQSHYEGGFYLQSPTGFDNIKKSKELRMSLKKKLRK